MKKMRLVLMAVLLIAALILATGCGQTPAEPETAEPTETEITEDTGDTGTEEEPVLHFKSGTWITDTNENYVFYEDGEGGKTVNVADGTGLGFTYELSKDGSCVFHMGGVDDVTETNVEFIGGGDETVAITFEDGSRIVLYYADEDTTGEYAEKHILIVDNVEAE